MCRFRALATGEHTAPHSDAFFFRGTEFAVAWTPLGDVPTAAGPLAVCAGSHTVDGYDDPRGVADTELPAGFAAYQETAPAPVWRTGDFRAGDVLVGGCHCGGGASCLAMLLLKWAALRMASR